VYIGAPHCNFNFNFNFYNWLLPALVTLIFLSVRLRIWQPSINERDDDDDYPNNASSQNIVNFWRNSSPGPTPDFAPGPHGPIDPLYRTQLAKPGYASA